MMGFLNSNILIRFVKLGRTFYVLPLIATAISGYMSGTANNLASMEEIFTICSIALSMLFVGVAAWSTNELTDRFSDEVGDINTKWGLYISGGTRILGVNASREEIREVILGIIILNTSAIAISYNIGYVYLAIISSIIMIGVTYSVEPIRIKSRGVYGLGTVAMAYGLLSYIAGFSASDGVLKFEVIFVGVTLSLVFFGFEGLSHLLDWKKDMFNKEKTLAVSIGYNNAKLLLALMQVTPIFYLLLSYGSVSLNLPMLLKLFLALALLSFAYLTLLSEKEETLKILRVLGVPMVSTLSFVL